MTYKIAPIAIAILFLSACADNAANPLEGEWRLVSAEITIGDETFTTFDPKTHRFIKIFTDDHFSFLSTQIHDRPRFSDFSLTDAQKAAAYSGFSAGGGTYSLSGNVYTENVEFCSFPNYEGQQISFNITIDGDRLIQEGTYPLIRLGLGDTDGYLKEVYERITN